MALEEGSASQTEEKAQGMHPPDQLKLTLMQWTPAQ